MRAFEQTSIVAVQVVFMGGVLESLSAGGRLDPRGSLDRDAGEQLSKRVGPEKS